MAAAPPPPNRRARKSQRRRDNVESRNLLRLVVNHARPPLHDDLPLIPLAIFDADEVQAVNPNPGEFMEGLGQPPAAGDGPANVPVLPMMDTFPLQAGYNLRDVMLPLDLMTRMAMRRCNRAFRDQAEDNMDEQRQCLDLNKLFHNYWMECRRANHPVPPHPIALAHQILRPHNRPVLESLLYRIGMLANAFPMAANGTLILRLHLAIHPVYGNSGGPLMTDSLASEFLSRIVQGHFRNATRVIFVDSCLLASIMSPAGTWAQCQDRVWFVRTYINSLDLCGHLVAPLYLHNYRQRFYPANPQRLEGYCEAMDTQMQFGDRAALKLLKHSLVRAWQSEPQASFLIIDLLRTLDYTTYRIGVDELFPNGEDSSEQEIMAMVITDREQGWQPSSVYVLALAMAQYKQGQGTAINENVNGCPTCTRVFVEGPIEAAFVGNGENEWVAEPVQDEEQDPIDFDAIMAQMIANGAFQF
ncbi:hypothetical protein RvY_04243 [Ramazzottius varieornatus]|uniref:Uncharacterized protein n=1 Tax=Ramazzottius varieornatus TaxID=947166 RepID=A0A1D1UUC3_RAMVA|nr:hypothetical protein RvY_04243 [Ramazzottius varieornatus]